MTTTTKTPVKALHPDFTLSPEKLRQTAEDALAKCRKNLDVLAAIPAGERTFENTVDAFCRILDDLSVETQAAVFPKYVSPDKAVREASHQCEGDIEKFSVDVYTRPELYAALKAVSESEKNLDPIDAKLLEKCLKEFKRNGLELEPLERARFKILTKQLLDMGLTFSQNLNEIKDFLAVTRKELDGLPEDYVNRLDKTPEGKYKITMDYPDVTAFLEMAHDGDARRRLRTMFHNRAVPDNAALLDEIFPLRRRLAKMLGFPSHAHFILEERMAKSPEKVAEFSDSMLEKLKGKGRKELERMAAMKKTDHPEDPELHSWDQAYYHHKLLKAEYDVDSTEVRQYFPMDRVLAGLFEVYQTLLGVRYEEKTPPHAWHPDLRYFETYDAESGEALGRFYLDLYPREGKYKHAAVFPLIGGQREKDGTYRLPLNAMVANFNKPTQDKPSLLEHSEVETLFHEFGHVMHGALTRAKYARFAGTSVVWDFVEAPSQMLENWVWQKEVLQKLSSHHETGKPLPDDLLGRMIAAKNLNSGVHYLRQLAYGRIDQAYNTSEPVDTELTFQRLIKEVTLTPAAPGTRPEASFGHLVGYDAAYYSYLWAKVFSADMFAVFEKEGVLDAQTGKRYRETVLEPGGEGDELGYVRTFLGREPTEDAFLKSIGL